MRKLKRSALMLTVYLSTMCMLSGCGLPGRKAEQTTEEAIQYEVIEDASALELDALKESAKFYESKNTGEDKNQLKIKRNPDLDGELTESQEQVIEKTTVYSKASKTSAILGYIDMNAMVTVLKREVKEGWALIAFQGRACYVDSKVFAVVEEETDTDSIITPDDENNTDQTTNNNNAQNNPDKKKDTDNNTDKKEETQKPSQNESSSDGDSSDSGSGSSVSDGSGGSSSSSSGDSSGGSSSNAPEKSDDKVTSGDSTPEKSDDKVTSGGSDTTKVEDKASE